MNFGLLDKKLTPPCPGYGKQAAAESGIDSWKIPALNR